MTELEMYGYVRARAGSLEVAERVLRDLQATGRALTVFEPLFGPKIRVEIRRSTSLT